jgi:hypothetical protein
MTHYVDYLKQIPHDFQECSAYQAVYMLDQNGEQHEYEICAIWYSIVGPIRGESIRFAPAAARRKDEK